MKNNWKKILSKFSIAILGGFLGTWAGADGTSKAWRRIGLPIIHTLTALCTLRNWLVILIMTHAGGLSLGYGIPDPTDEGSAIGKFWYKCLKNNHRRADIATRLTVGVVKTLPFVIIPILIGKWLIYAIIAVLAVLVNDFIGGYWHPKGMITVFKKKLLLEEFLIYFGETLLYHILILWR